MLGITSYIKEGFYQTVGSADEVKRLKFQDKFEHGNIPAFLKRLGIRISSVSAGMLIAYLIKCCEAEHKLFLLNGMAMGNNRRGSGKLTYYLEYKELIKWENGQGDFKDLPEADNSIYRFGVSWTQDISVRSVADLKHAVQIKSKGWRMSAMTVNWIIDPANGLNDNQFIIYPYSDTLRDASDDMEKILKELGVNYKKINLSRSGTAKNGNVIIADNIAASIK